MSGPISRRRLLLGGAAGAAGVALVAAGARPGAANETEPANQTDGVINVSDGSAQVDCHGPHQAGIVTPTQANGSFVAFRLVDGVDRPALRRLLRLWDDDITRLTSGRAALADPVPELAVLTARLTVTLGLGPGFFDAAGMPDLRPSWLAPLPTFQGDALQEAYSGGDLLLQVCADDPVTVSHAVSVLAGSAASFARVAWRQDGFNRANGIEAPGKVGRNLLGFLDGTANPKGDDLDEVVWGGTAGSWTPGGTALIVRRIRLHVQTWSSLSTAQREQVFGRRVADGEPLSGGGPDARPDLAATDARGLSVILPSRTSDWRRRPMPPNGSCDALQLRRRLRRPGRTGPGTHLRRLLRRSDPVVHPDPAAIGRRRPAQHLGDGGGLGGVRGTRRFHASGTAGSPSRVGADVGSTGTHQHSRLPAAVLVNSSPPRGVRPADAGWPARGHGRGRPAGRAPAAGAVVEHGHPEAGLVGVQPDLDVARMAVPTRVADPSRTVATTPRTAS